MLLATVNLNADGNITDTAFDAPQHVYGNKALFDMLLCSGGGEGPSGLGLDRSLPKILDVAWKHNDPYKLFTTETVGTTVTTVHGSLLAPFFDGGTFLDMKLILRRIAEGNTNPPLFTVYFDRPLRGIDKNTFLVTLRFEVMIPFGTGVLRTGMYFDVPVAGDIGTAPPDSAAIQTPNTHESFGFAATFLPHITFYVLALNTALKLLKESALRTDNAELAFATMRIQLKGDFITSEAATAALAEHSVLDANNIGGWVGTSHLRDPNFIAENWQEESFRKSHAGR